jgi:hypothetical protein
MTTITKYITIGLYSPRGTSCTIHMVNGKPKRFDSIMSAVAFIEANNLGASASPVEIYEE